MVDFDVTDAIQNWSNGDSNLGLIFLQDGSPPFPTPQVAWTARSDDWTTQSERPLLSVTFEGAAVPEPSEILLGILAVAGLVVARRRRFGP